MDTSKKENKHPFAEMIKKYHKSGPGIIRISFGATYKADSFCLVGDEAIVIIKHIEEMIPVISDNYER